MQWAAPKQTGDYFNDGLSEALIYRPELCGVDLLYNESSHWLAYLDTSSPCLKLPKVLYDRVVARLLLDCDLSPPGSAERSERAVFDAVLEKTSKFP